MKGERDRRLGGMWEPWRAQLARLGLKSELRLLSTVRWKRPKTLRSPYEPLTWWLDFSLRRGVSVDEPLEFSRVLGGDGGGLHAGKQMANKTHKNRAQM